MRGYTRHPVKTTLEPLDGNKVKLTVELDQSEFDASIDLAFKKIAHEVRLPGFRAGKAPRKLLEARIGLAAARQQAIQDSVPLYLSKAVREHDIDLIATPDVKLVSGEEEGAVSFDATCRSVRSSPFPATRACASNLRRSRQATRKSKKSSPPSVVVTATLSMSTDPRRPVTT